jgi:hypothetical protein
MEEIAGNPLSTSPHFVDGKWGKPSALIMEPNPKGIKRVEPVTSPTDHWGRDLTSGSRPLELTLGAKSWNIFTIIKFLFLLYFFILFI